MASLRTLTQKTTVEANESNLERGRIWTFTPTSSNGTSFFPSGQFCWCAPAAGRVTVEIWGAAGSSSRMCCCGYGLPGNSGAYAKRTYTVGTNCYICGCVGIACGDASALSFRGCGTPTVVCINCGGTTATMCAQSGRGGCSVCSTSSTSIFNTFFGTYCGTAVGTGCGIICNIGATPSFIPTASGGDINCSGSISCVFFGHCNSCCTSCHINYVKIANGIFSEGHATAAFAIDLNTLGNGSSGVAVGAMASAVSGLSRSPTAIPYMYCWGSGSYCACYESHGCMNFFGTGVPGGPVTPFGSVVDNGMRGAPGAVRIQFIAS